MSQTFNIERRLDSGRKYVLQKRISDVLAFADLAPMCRKNMRPFLRTRSSFLRHRKLKRRSKSSSRLEYRLRRGVLASKCSFLTAYRVWNIPQNPKARQAAIPTIVRLASTSLIALYNDIVS